MKVKKKKSESLSALLGKAQNAFNKWVRERDHYKGCISCGATVTEAGHYFSRGHYSALRFNEVNVNGQCTRCNCFMHGNLINYRQGLVRKYGETTVQQLELSANLRKVKKWSRIELEIIIGNYKTVVRET